MPEDPSMAGKLKPRQSITHHFRIEDILKASETFGHAGGEHALKVLSTN